MLKLFNDHARDRFAAAMRAALPAYTLKKSLKGPASGLVNFEHRIDARRAGWIGFGGFKERDFFVYAAWTVSGSAPRELPEWEQYANPRAFEVPPVPADGYVDLRDRWRFEPGGKDAWFPLSLPDPEPAFSQAVCERYLASPGFERDVERSLEGARRLYTKNPPTPESVRHDAERTERAYSRLWSHLATRHAFSEAELDTLTAPVVAEALRLAQTYGAPLIARQLGEAGAA